MALTLIEAAKLNAGTVLQRTLIEIFAGSHPVLAAMPFTNIAGNAYRYNQESALPGIAFRAVNGSYTASTGVLNPAVEPLMIVGGELDIDNFIVQTMGMEQRSVQESMKLKSLAHTWAHKIIKGDNTTTTTEFDGLQRRLVGDQLIAAGSASSGDALSMKKLDELIDQVASPTHLLMSRAMKRLLTTAARTYTLHNITFDVGQFGVPIMRYAGIPIVTVDDPDFLYASLAFDEACPGGGSSVGTSIYCVSLTQGKFHGIQNGIPMVEDLGKLQTSPLWRTRIEWYAGVVLEHPRGAARLYGIKNAAVAA